MERFYTDSLEDGVWIRRSRGGRRPIQPNFRKKVYPKTPGVYRRRLDHELSPRRGHDQARGRDGGVEPDVGHEVEGDSDAPDDGVGLIQDEGVLRVLGQAVLSLEEEVVELLRLRRAVVDVEAVNASPLALEHQEHPVQRGAGVVHQDRRGQWDVKPARLPGIDQHVRAPAVVPLARQVLRRFDGDGVAVDPTGVLTHGLSRLLWPARGRIARSSVQVGSYPSRYPAIYKDPERKPGNYPVPYPSNLGKGGAFHEPARRAGFAGISRRNPHRPGARRAGRQPGRRGGPEGAAGQARGGAVPLRQGGDRPEPDDAGGVRRRGSRRVRLSRRLGAGTRAALQPPGQAGGGGLRQVRPGQLTGL